jgi:hypothetical protein
MGWKIKELRFNFQQGQETFSFSKALHTRCGAHSAFYLMTNQGIFLWGKVAWSMKLTTHSYFVL